MTKFLGPAQRQKLKMKVYYAKLKYKALWIKGRKNSKIKLNDSYKWIRSINPKMIKSMGRRLVIKTFGMKYYIWHSPTKKIRTLDHSGNDQSQFAEQVLVKTFRAKSWQAALDKFHEMGSSLDKEDTE